MPRLSVRVYVMLFLLCAGGAHAVLPPAQPMVIHGEVLAEGREVPEGTELKVSVKGQEISLKIGKSEEGISRYVLKIHAFAPNKPVKAGEFYASEGDEVRFLSLGSHTLAQLPPLKWKQGSILKKDIIVNQVIQNAPSIRSASVVQNGDKWLLKCTVSPVVQDRLDPASLSYQVRWFYRKAKDAGQPAADGKKAYDAVLVKEETLKALQADKESELTYEGKLADMQYLEVVATPVVTTSGAKGPSAMRNVFPVMTQGGI